MPFPLWKRELWHFQSFFFTLHHETYQKLDSHPGTANSAAAVEEKGSQGDCLAILPADLHADLHADLQVGSNIYIILIIIYLTHTLPSLEGNLGLA